MNIVNKLIKVYSATRLDAAGIAARKRDGFFISGVHLKSNGFHLTLIELCCRCVDTPEGRRRCFSSCLSLLNRCFHEERVAMDPLPPSGLILTAVKSTAGADSAPPVFTILVAMLALCFKLLLFVTYFVVEKWGLLGLLNMFCSLRMLTLTQNF